MVSLLSLPSITKGKNQLDPVDVEHAITGNCACEDSCRKNYRTSETQVYFIRRHTINKVLKL